MSCCLSCSASEKARVMEMLQRLEEEQQQQLKETALTPEGDTHISTVTLEERLAGLDLGMALSMLSVVETAGSEWNHNTVVSAEICCANEDDCFI